MQRLINKITLKRVSLILVVSIVIIIAVGAVSNKIDKTNLSLTNTSNLDNQKVVNDTNLIEKVINESWNTYRNDKYNFSFEYPQNWTIEERDPAKTFDSESTELSLWLIDGSSKLDSVIVTVNSKDISKTTPVGGTDPNYKQELVFKGNNSVKYTFPQSEEINRIMYHISVDQKTYMFETLNEEKILRYNPEYMSVFDKIIESVELK